MKHIKLVPTNKNGRTFFVTDIHGYFNLLEEKLVELNFDKSKDILISGGDNIDRGPNSVSVLDYIDKEWFYSVKGNHCKMLCDHWENSNDRGFYQMFYFNGGSWFFDLTQDVQEKIYEAVVNLPLGIEYTSKSGRKIGIVHAEVPGNDWNYFKEMTNAELKWNGEAVAQWARTKYDKKNTDYVKNIHTVLVGHTPTDSGNVEVIGNVVYCDAGSFFRNKLNILEII